MSNRSHASIAALGYHGGPGLDLSGFVAAVEAALALEAPLPCEQHRSGDHIALIDSGGSRIALGVLPPTQDDPYGFLVIAAGDRPDRERPDTLPVAQAHDKLTDRLVRWLKDDRPFNTIMRGETPETVEPLLIETIFELLRTSPGLSQSVAPQPPAARSTEPNTATRQLGIIEQDEIEEHVGRLAAWLQKRAVPTPPLRLTVHAVGMSVMLHTPPLGAFMLTYSLLRDIRTGT